MESFLSLTVGIALDIAPWLLLGLVVAGLIRGLLTERMIARLVSGSGAAAVLRASLIGAPLPLCSCGAIPTALALHRAGAGRGPSTAFLVSTPGIGVDALALSYVLLGPVMALARALSSVAVAVATGLAVAERAPAPGPAGRASARRCDGADADCCGGAAVASPQATAVPLGPRLVGGLRYAATDLVDDMGIWLLVGLAATGLVMTFVPPDSLAAYGSGVGAMLLLAFAGVPVYLCATAATPIAAGMLAAGVSPGAVLVFLLAGPITSLVTLSVLRAEFGWPFVVRYVSAIAVACVAAGLLADAAFAAAGVTVQPIAGDALDLVPDAAKVASAALLLILFLRPVRRVLWRWCATTRRGASDYRHHFLTGLRRPFPTRSSSLASSRRVNGR